ncbi:hypothetical protein [Natrialbaceae archaeon AArc-T1-2]|uniref:hypothetical protein n=1 Tax=Natrialbaceae archaeon AArc-T1-2 TaxID=3053904 RepID=UPI00255B3006|nr:hypothetical protein [Natrialbaceae archaeon AArc-T1-2]WIV68314.1 hypothetical protein QQ977_06220 [Natrialbaceae archaeon AArc-T1-2]
MSSELLVESLSLLVYAALAAILTVGGVLVEYTSFQHFGAGETTVALWLAAIGAVMLYAGVGLGYRKVLTRLTR